LKIPPVNASLFKIIFFTTSNLIRRYRLDIEHLVFDKGPKRVGPFSHAVKAGDFIFITGQMPTLPDNPDVLISNDVEEQTHQVMKNLINVSRTMWFFTGKSDFCKSIPSEFSRL
jgi:enamine deaminase RidA (YjgF/YER057c/UK114 family)